MSNRPVRQADGMTEPQEERYQPLALIGVTLVALLGFAVFFLSFLVAPLAILIIFYVGFAASDRSKRNQSKRAQAAADDDESGDADGGGKPEPQPGSAALLARAHQHRRATIERSHQRGPDER